MLERTRTYEIIRNTSGGEIVRVPIDKDCKVIASLMTSNYIQLVFTLDTPVYFPIGSYVDDELFGRFYVTEEQMPTYETATAGYKYTLKLNAWYYLWNLKAFMLTAVHIDNNVTFRKESVWYLTNSLKEQMREFMINLQVLGFVGINYDFKTGDTDLNKFVSINTDDVSTYAQALTMSYSATMMLDALKTMANTWECEYWITGSEDAFVIHFGKCQDTSSAEQTLTLEDNIESLSVTNSVSNYADKLYFFGGKDNIPNTYRKELRMHAYDVQANGAGNVESFQCKKYTTDSKVAELTEDNLPSTFNVKFVGGGITTSSTYKTRGTISTGQNNIVSAFTAAHADYANHNYELLRTISYRAEVEMNGVKYDLSNDTDLAAFNEKAYNNNDTEVIIRVIAEQITELYNATTQDFNTLRRDPIALTEEQWRNITGFTELGYPYYEKQQFSFGGIFLMLNTTSSVPEDADNLPTTGAYLVASATADNAYNAIGNASTYGEGSSVTYGYTLHGDAVIKLYWHCKDGAPKGSSTYITDEDYLIKKKSDVEDTWQGWMDYGDEQQVTIKSSESLTLKEWKMVAANSNGALVTNSDGTFTLGGMFTLSMTADGKNLQSEVYSYTDKSVELPTIPTSIIDVNMDFGTNFIQIVPTAEATKYEYYHISTLIDTLDVSDTSSEAEDDGTTENLCYQTNQRERYYFGYQPLLRSLNCASEVAAIGTDATLDMSFEAQTLKARVKVKALDGVTTAQLSGNCQIGIIDGYNAKYASAGLIIDNFGQSSVIESVLISKGLFDTEKTAVTAADGYFYIDVEVSIPAAAVSCSMTDFTKNTSYYGYAVGLVLNTDISLYDANGESITSGLGEEDVKIELYQDSAVSVVINGVGVKIYNAHAGKSGTTENTTRIYFDTPINASYLPENTELIIISDYIYKVPYIYYTSALDDPSSITSIGDQRLQLPNYDADEFAKYKRDGWTYENGYICYKDMAYKDGYIIPKSSIGQDDAHNIKEMAVVDDEIYPDGKLLVKSVTGENKKQVTEVENDDNIPWSYQQFHLTLQRPDGSDFTFAKDYILQNGDSLQIRFLVPEDIADQVSDDTLNTIKENCRLAGMQFDVNFKVNPSYTDSEGNYGSHPQDYTIVRNDDFGMMLPNNVLYPAINDPCVLVNWNVKALAALGLINEAEYRLLDKAFEYFAALKDGNFTFTLNMMSKFMFDLYGKYITLGDSTGANIKESGGAYLRVKNGYDCFTIPLLGQKVKISTKALKNDQSTRVIGYEYKLDKPFDTPKLTCGESEAYSRLKQLEKEITNKLS